MKIPFDDWECLDATFQGDEVTTWRVKVFGGWVFKEEYYSDDGNALHCSLLYIPDPNHEWEVE